MTQEPPTDLRSMFELFKFYHPEVGLEQLLRNSGVTGMSPRQVYQAVHDRAPDSLSECLMDGYDPIKHFIAAVSSGEFQSELAARLLRAFPEKRRLFFVHIPKTAGVELASHLQSRYASINTNLLNPILTPGPEQIFLAIKHVVLEMSVSDTIFISGHNSLGTYQLWNGNGIRHGDQVFAVIRNPLDQLLSQVNYVLTRIFSREEPVSIDTKGWRTEFGINDLKKIEESQDEIIKLGRQILRHEGVVIPNVICRFIGGGTYDTAVTQTVSHDLELTDLANFNLWLEQRWGVTNCSRLNASRKFISKEDLAEDDQIYCRDIIQEDLRYYIAVLDALRWTGRSSVRGSQIIGKLIAFQNS